MTSPMQRKRHLASDRTAHTLFEAGNTPFETGFLRHPKQKPAPIETERYAIRNRKVTPFETGNLLQATDFIEEFWAIKGTSTYKINSELFLERFEN